MGTYFSDNYKFECREPFARGRFRLAYKGCYIHPILQYLYGNYEVVVKVNEDTYTWNPTDLDTTLKMNKEAQKLAKAYSLFLGNRQVPMSVSFTNVDMIQVFNINRSYCPQSILQVGEYCTVEDYIPGPFKKWCNNYGYISAEAKSTHYAMPAFMHWSWWHSKGEKMISDLQGVHSENPSRYTLTDPAMLSRTKSYGATDMGVEGMAMFFLNHECNSICRHLSKPENISNVDSVAYRKQLKDCTFYTREINLPS